MTPVEQSISTYLTGVIDLWNGQAVHAVAGQRHLYRPVELTDVTAGNAIQLAQRYRRHNLNSLYIADLNAIRDAGHHLDLIKQLVTNAVEVWIDVGAVISAFSAQWNPLPSQVKFVVPTECYSVVADWIRDVNCLPRGKVVLGLDIRGGNVRTAKDPCLDFAMPSLRDQLKPWLDAAEQCGVNEVVVLDLAYVGASHGLGTVEVCKWIAASWPHLRLISGGGVKGAQDAMALLQAGCDRVLVATALHDDASDLVQAIHSRSGH